MSKIVGILGGMGPLATVDLFGKIVQNTPAKADQEHLRIIIDNHPQIPSRVEAALRGGPSPLPAMIESARLLEAAGVDFIVMPCNTAHYWLDELRRAVGVPIGNMIENAAGYIADRHRDFSGRILLLATEATVRTGLYQQAFAAAAMTLQVPAETEQRVVDAAIHGVKAGEVTQNSHLAALNAILDRYAQNGTTAIIGGCTEIPLLFPYFSGKLQQFDATLLLARMVVARAVADE